MKSQLRFFQMTYGIFQGTCRSCILDRGAHMAALEKDKPNSLVSLGVRIQYSTNQVRDSPENTLSLEHDANGRA